MSKYGVFSGPYFSVFSPNTGEYGPEKNSVLGHFSRSDAISCQKINRWCIAYIAWHYIHICISNRKYLYLYIYLFIYISIYLSIINNLSIHLYTYTCTSISMNAKSRRKKLRHCFWTVINVLKKTSATWTAKHL